MKKLFLTFIISLIIFSFISFKNYNTNYQYKIKNKILSDSIINPNGNSELALLMRKMFDDSQTLKSQIKNGETPEFFMEFEKLHKAKPTDTLLKDDGMYTAFANVYIESVNHLINNKGDKIEKYNRMVNMCISCHEYMCPGPIKKIRKLRIKK